VELAKIDDALRQEKEQHDRDEAEESLRLLQIDSLKSPVAKTIIRDAFLTYRSARPQSHMLPTAVYDSRFVVL
jgi:hypothetical protein